jgi:hypothetical protein
MKSALMLLGLVVLAGGCFDDDDDCRYYAYELAPAYELRDPQTGQCQAYGGGGDCTDPCSPCSLGGDREGAAEPDWAMCYSSCEALDEITCKATAGCRAAYAGSAFHQCWAVAPSGPVQGGDCSTYDAQTCSRHDDCIALHAAGSPIGTFSACAAESQAQDPGSCVGAISCDALPPDCPDGTLPGRRDGCWTGYCIPYGDCDELPACSSLAEADCIERSDCEPTYVGNSCTCSATSCTCQSWSFDTCRTE